MATTAALSKTAVPTQASPHWLKRYYGSRALFSAVWVLLAFTVGKAQPTVGAVLLVAYPLGDCLANFVDAAHSGGLPRNPTQLLNVIVSAIVTLTVVVTCSPDFHAAIGVVGAGAALSGLLRLLTGIRRWRNASAQWPRSGAARSPVWRTRISL